MKVNFFFVLWTAIIILIPMTSLAKLKITPVITVKETFNDNIFLKKTDREHDFITTIYPRVGLTYSLRKSLDFNLNYGLSFRYYSRHSELNDTSMSQSQNIRFKTMLRPLNHVSIDISDVYRRIPEDARRPVAIENIFTNMTDSNVFRVSPNIEYPLTSTLSTLLGYSYVNTWYRVEEGNDSESHSAFISLSKQFPFRLKVSLNYNFTARRPESNNDYDAHHGSVGASSQVSSHWVIYGNIGKTYLDFLNESNESSEETKSWNIGTEYKLNILGETSLGASYSNSLSETEATVDQLRFSESLYFLYIDPEDQIQIMQVDLYTLQKNSIITGVTERESANLYFRTGKYFNLKVNTFYVEEEELQTDREDRTKGVSVGISKSLSNKLSPSINGSWRKHKFLPEDEKVDSYSAGCNLNYKISNSITADAGYRYNSSDSNMDASDFHNNIAWVQAKMIF